MDHHTASIIEISDYRLECVSSNETVQELPGGQSLREVQQSLFLPVLMCAAL